MSSDDSGFDKEAEREKLREKYEKDKKDRESTQRMSELLLQGATMTGKHCGDCGDPIFRYDGQEFCPTCQREVERDAAAESDDDIDADATTAADSGAEVESGAVDSDADGPRVEINDVRVADRHADRSDLRDPPSRTGRRTDDSRGSGGSPGADRPGGAHDDPTRARGRESGEADLATARASLVRTLTDLARRAEETDDVARTRDLLAASREAAEALAALDRANR
ncbi:hypothetical protein NGM10_08565 [Halorussus salilacus]|uniref:Sjogren's syndrome/scleroderma autoantigen 1 family protein n=1 Tax=Halorussus salilacus TaxID=2953750 RepID=UPI00209F9759|nr:Sjogren's syndrome/scleroderma autoantigen 1 family protein [Halorussus salilacus]USZ66785.1 hypothetical protein NGM10_08565 [Halorussus salilacus]